MAVMSKPQQLRVLAKDCKSGTVNLHNGQTHRPVFGRDAPCKRGAWSDQTCLQIDGPPMRNLQSPWLRSATPKQTALPTPLTPSSLVQPCSLSGRVSFPHLCRLQPSHPPSRPSHPLRAPLAHHPPGHASPSLACTAQHPHHFAYVSASPGLSI